MKFSVRKGDITKEACDVLIVGAFEGFKTFGGSTAEVDKALGGLLQQVAKEEMFKGKLDTSLLLYTHKLLPAKRVLLIGLGKEEEFGEEAVREASAHALQRLQKIDSAQIVSVLHGAGHGKIPAEQAAKAVTEGFLLGSYSFNKHKKQTPIHLPKQITFVTRNNDLIAGAKSGVRLGEIFAQATILARDLVNEPSEHLRPKELVDATKQMVKDTGNKLQIKVYNKAALKKMGAGGILGVAQGSIHEPFLVHVIYKPVKKAKKRVAFIGKAITFDSGGLSLKPWDAMITMKLDMGGAAAVIGAMSALPALAPDVEVHGVYGACENMPSGSAIHPGDVVKTINGTTIEITNTDAEGRVTLADTLAYAQKQKPDLMVDLATLTGACMVALGEEIAGLMCDDSPLTKGLMEASERSGEKLWPLPLEKRYRKMLDSKVADINNLSSPPKMAGAITAGLFLKDFVSKDIPWAHLDIAGPAFAERAINTYTRHGASGFGVRLLLELIRGI